VPSSLAGVVTVPGLGPTVGAVCSRGVGGWLGARMRGSGQACRALPECRGAGPWPTRGFGGGGRGLLGGCNGIGARGALVAGAPEARHRGTQNRKLRGWELHVVLLTGVGLGNVGALRDRKGCIGTVGGAACGGGAKLPELECKNGRPHTTPCPATAVSARARSTDTGPAGDEPRAGVVVGCPPFQQRARLHALRQGWRRGLEAGKYRCAGAPARSPHQRLGLFDDRLPTLWDLVQLALGRAMINEGSSRFRAAR
jgi:hypothetical protein